MTLEAMCVVAVLGHVWVIKPQHTWLNYHATSRSALHKVSQILEELIASQLFGSYDVFALGVHSAAMLYP